MFNREDQPKVFISYSWSSPEHENFVLSLAKNLMSDGINVIFDKWDLKEGQDKYAFMEKMVSDETIIKVLIISDKKYSERADKKIGGVGTESQIISNEIYSKIDQEKFIPVVTEKNSDGKPYLPTFLKNRIYVDLSSDELFHSGYEKLVRLIYDKPLLKKPELGIPPDFILEDSPIVIKTSHQFKDLKRAILDGKNSIPILSENFLNSILESLEDFRIKSNSNSFDDEIIKSIELFKSYRDQLIEFFNLISLTSNNIIIYDQIFRFIEKFLYYYYPPKSVKNYNEEWFDNYKFLLLELFLYLNAILLKNKRFDYFNYFTEELYFVKTNLNKDYYSFSIINKYLKSLNELRNKRLGLQRISVTSDILKNRCDSHIVNFQEIMEVDFILTLKWFFTFSNKYNNYWYPRTLLYKVGWNAKPFPIFQKASTKTHFEILKKIFHIKSKNELKDKFDSINKKFGLYNFQINYERIPFEILMNLDNLYNG